MNVTDLRNFERQFLTNRSTNYGSVNSFIRVILVLLLRAGFIFIQLGSNPTENIFRILVHNILDIAAVTAAYGLIGFIFAFGYDWIRTIGTGTWINSPEADMDDALFGWCAIITSTALVTAMVGGRLKANVLLTIISLSAIFIHPVLIHLIWSDSGFMRKLTLLGYKVSFKDQGGAGIVHVPGALIGLLITIVLGRRLINIKDLDEKSMTPDSPGKAVVGYIFIIIGLYGMSLPSTMFEHRRAPYNYVGLSLMNNLMATSGGLIMMTVVQVGFRGRLYSYWTAMSCIQGGVSAIVAISAGSDIYSPLGAFAIGTISALLCHYCQVAMYHSSLEDNCNIVSVHLVNGVLSVLMPPIFGNGDGLGIALSGAVMFVDLLWQFCCILIILLYVSAMSLIITIPLYACCKFINHGEQVSHKRAIKIENKLPERSFFTRLFQVSEQSALLEPGGRSGGAYKNIKMFSTIPNVSKGWSRGDFIVPAPALNSPELVNDTLEMEDENGINLRDDIEKRHADSQSDRGASHAKRIRHLELEGRHLEFEGRGEHGREQNIDCSLNTSGVECAKTTVHKIYESNSKSECNLVKSNSKQRKPFKKRRIARPLTGNKSINNLHGKKSSLKSQTKLQFGKTLIDML